MTNPAQLKTYCNVREDPSVRAVCTGAVDSCEDETTEALRQSCFSMTIACTVLNDSDRAGCFARISLLTRPPAVARPSSQPPQSASELTAPQPLPLSPPLPPAPPPPPAPRTEPELEPEPTPTAIWEPDGKMKFAASLARAGFEITVGTSETIKRPGFFCNDESYFPELKINYTVTKLGGGRYKMAYEIRRYDGYVVGKSDGFEFTAVDGKINEQFEFGITLGEEGNFQWISAAGIYKYENGNYTQM